ncbi:uncharacterized protein JKF63_07958 [Porcisia hertigi]|uniref:Uncharacterized protein n=1 Tax=Porcisia hertigi TaxID=2761500 RepID=A0A836L4N8_9TRYP|nr:hypothetical protein JKF63_07958 [Porcisia hertigi]
MMMCRSFTAAVVTVAVALALTSTDALAQAGQTCPDTTNPLAKVDYTDAAVQSCVVERCSATLGTVPTLTTSGFCNGDATTESSVECSKLWAAYSEYYACLMRALQGTTHVDLTALGAEVSKFMSTPGFPYRLSVLGCYTCNHFRLSVFPLLGSTCAAWTCATISSQSPSAPMNGQPDRGYNQRLCSTGCIASVMMIPFTVVTCALFLACCFCWPSPSLKTTYEAWLQEERKEKARGPSVDHGTQREPTYGIYNAAHEPLARKDS